MEPEKNQFIFHDAWNEYAVVLPEKIKNLVCHWCWIALLHGII
jgi:hypothetical protein